MKEKIIIILTILFIVLGITLLSLPDKSYSYGLIMKITGTKGNRVLKYYDADSNTEVSIDVAVKYYGATEYMLMYDNGNVYFYRGKEISKSAYEKGSESEEADKRVRDLGEAAYRVRNTNEVKNAIKDIYTRHRIGTFYLEFTPSEYDTINWREIKAFYKNNYGLKEAKQNYYNYTLKGEFEPDRFNNNISPNRDTGEMLIDSRNIRITDNEYKIVDSFISDIFPLMQGDGSDYERILAVYTYITKTTSYLTDNGFINDLLASNTSIYDVFINRKSVCIGYSIAFSYIMDMMGIESYIVDAITEINEKDQTFSSVHTYNIVALDGKFYKVDLTGKIFLDGINPNELSSNTLNLSSRPYNTSGKPTTYKYDYNLINNKLASAKKITTTTTTRANRTTTSMPTTSFKVTTNKTTTTKSINETTTTTSNIVIDDTTTTSSKNIINSTTPVITTKKTTITTTKTSEEEKEQKRKTVNKVGRILFISVIVLYILYRIIFYRRTKVIFK